MKKIAFLINKNSPRLEYLVDVLNEEYELLFAHNKTEIKKILSDSFNQLSALIVDNPSEVPYIDELFENLEKRNSYMFSIPVILLSDNEHVEKDDKYLCDLAVGMITKGESKKIVLQRIKNTIAFSNSRSFDDFSRMLRALPSLIYVKDIDGRYAFCSQRWHHILKPGESIRGLTDFDIRKDKNNARIAQESDTRVIKSGKGMTYVIKEDTDEGIDYLQIIKEPLKNENGEVTGIIAIINNVTDQEVLRQELRYKSITDQLTGVYNRMYFEEFSKEHEGNLDVPLTIITADCDGLKRINDKYGHLSGDKYICWARDVIKESLPEGALIFRMGGDEFLAVLPKTDKLKAAIYVKNITHNAKKYKNEHFELSISVGSHTATKKTQSIETVVGLSDKEMYKMKKAQRK
jgi:diguanylate cyclase (GGDEF)-like protein